LGTVVVITNPSRLKNVSECFAASCLHGFNLMLRLNCGVGASVVHHGADEAVADHQHTMGYAELARLTCLLCRIAFVYVLPLNAIASNSPADTPDDIYVNPSNQCICPPSSPPPLLINVKALHKSMSSIIKIGPP